MTTRFLLPFLLIGSIALLSACSEGNTVNTGQGVYTVNGWIGVEELGITLTHEHVMSNFGKETGETGEYDEAALLDQVIPYLRELHHLGVRTIVDCTTEYFGRRVDLLKTISDSTGIQLITNTGMYGSANDRYVPAFAYEVGVDSLANIWIAEFQQGIQETEIRPGFIKLAFDDGPPSEIDIKLFEAGIMAHKTTDLTLAVHTGNNPEAAALQQRLLEQYGVGLDAWIWTHANKVENDSLLLDAAARGAWISLDGVKESNVGEYVERLKRFQSQSRLDRVLLSHDGNGFPGGGSIRDFSAIPKFLIPALLENGFTKEELYQLQVINPQRAFGLK